MKPSQTEEEPLKAPMIIIPMEDASDVMSIRLASLYVDDGNQFWLETMPQILAAYHLNPTDYWALTVAEHQMLHLALQTKADADGG